ncbi:MAG TPA: hypothetical protein VFR48_10535, partial [Solirubrobacteraceae bacterium]|nr:hypothetical protein [Solirubrobacteraceae bacterium]
DEVVDHYPSECRGCGHEFTDLERVPRSGAGRHQVAELPPIAVRQHRSIYHYLTQLFTAHQHARTMPALI